MQHAATHCRIASTCTLSQPHSPTLLHTLPSTLSPELSLQNCSSHTLSATLSHAPRYSHNRTPLRSCVLSHPHSYGVATIIRLLKIIDFFCKRALRTRRYSAKETYNCKEFTNCSHPIPAYSLIHTRTRATAAESHPGHTLRHSLAYTYMLVHPHSHTHLLTQSTSCSQAPTHSLKHTLIRTCILSQTHSHMHLHILSTTLSLSPVYSPKHILTQAIAAESHPHTLSNTLSHAPAYFLIHTHTRTYIPSLTRNCTLCQTHFYSCYSC